MAELDPAVIDSDAPKALGARVFSMHAHRIASLPLAVAGKHPPHFIRRRVDGHVLTEMRNAGPRGGLDISRSGHLDVGALETGCRELSTIPYCLLYTSPSPRDATLSRMPSSA